METKTVYAIRCSTGCTCCSYENFTEGFFQTKEEVEERISEYERGVGNPLASQYAKYGHYSLITSEAEILQDGRAIIGDRIFNNLDYHERLGDEYIL